jgi:hypothetical protein
MRRSATPLLRFRPPPKAFLRLYASGFALASRATIWRCSRAANPDAAGWVYA